MICMSIAILWLDALAVTSVPRPDSLGGGSGSKVRDIHTSERRSTVPRGYSRFGSYEHCMLDCSLLHAGYRVGGFA